MIHSAYRILAYFGLGSFSAAILYGFRFNASAPASSYLVDIALFSLWAGVHLVMTRGWFKKAAYGSPTGSLFERQVFIVTTVVTWLALIGFHFPVPGFSFELPGALRFVGHVGFVLAVVAFFEGTTFDKIDGLLGVPASSLTHSHGAETPLLTEGQYARVRHPMYRAALLAGASSLLIHPNSAQVLWCLLIGTTFLAFIPIEERQLIDARGDDYRRYMQATPWRVFRGIW